MNEADIERRVSECYTQYRIETATSFDYVDGYERARLFDYYTQIATPCLGRSRASPCRTCPAASSSSPTSGPGTRTPR